MPTNTNRNKVKEVNSQQIQDRLRILTSRKDSSENPINDIINKTEETTEQKRDEQEIINNQSEPNEKDLSSLQNRFGVRKINRPVKDAQLTARIDSKTLKRFKDIVKQMYYPDKPNINETVTQIIRAFVEEYDKNNNQTTKEEHKNIYDTESV